MPGSRHKDEEGLISRQEVSSAFLSRPRKRGVQGSFKPRNTLNQVSRAPVSNSASSILIGSGSKIGSRCNNEAGGNRFSKRQKLTEVPESISDSEEDVLGQLQGQAKLKHAPNSVQVRIERTYEKPRSRPKVSSVEDMTPEYSSVEKLMSSKDYGRNNTDRGKKFTPQSLHKPSNGFSDQLAQGPQTRSEYNVVVPNTLGLDATANATESSSRYFEQQRTPLTEDFTGSIADADELDHTSKPQAARRVRHLEDHYSPSVMISKKEPTTQRLSSITRPAKRTSVLQELDSDALSFKSDDQPTKVSETLLGGPDLATKSRENGNKQGRFSIPWFATDKAPQGKQGDFSLVYNPSRQCLDLHVEDSVIEEDWMSMKAIHQIHCPDSAETTQLLVKMSKRESKPTTMYIKCERHRVFADLALFLTKQSQVEVRKENAERMKKMFSKIQQLRPSTTSQGDTPDDMQLIIEKKRRREMEARPQLEEEPDHKKPKLRRKLRDRLQGEAVPDETLGGYAHTQFKGIPGRVAKTDSMRTEDAGDSTRKHSFIDELLKKNDIRAPSPKRAGLRSRSTRNSMAQNHDTDMVEELPERPRYSKVHGLGKEWKRPLTFPKEGKRRATVEFSDLPKLDEDQCLNDNLIEFYLRYLIHNLDADQPEIAKSVYFFNTYFFSSLKGASAKINYNGVKKWTRNVDLFTHDFIVVPINENFHWYVAIICNLPNLTRKAPTVTVDSDVEVLPADGDQMDPVIEAYDDNQVQKAEVENPEPHISPEVLYDTIIVDSGSSLQQEAEKARESFSDLCIDDDQIPSKISRKETSLVDCILDDEAEKAGGSPPRQFTEFRVPKRIPENSDQQHEVIADSPTSPKLTKGNLSQRKGRRKSSHPPKTIDPDLPAIITLDSLGFSHPPAIKALKQYLCEEASEKRGGMAIEPNQIKGMTAKGIPQQSNFSDCGLYLLGYMDKFAESPREFVSKLLQKEYNETTDWPQLQPSEMRARVRELVQELHQDQENEHADKRKRLPRVSDAGLETKFQEGGHGIKSSKIDDSAAARAEEQLPTIPNQDEGEKKVSESGTAEQHSNHTPTRQCALESALPLDAPDTKGELAKSTSDSPNTLKNARQSASPSADMQTVFVVPDSQEEEDHPEHKGAGSSNIQPNDSTVPLMPSMATAKENALGGDQLSGREDSPTPQRSRPENTKKEYLQSTSPSGVLKGPTIARSGDDDRWRRELEREAAKGKREAKEVSKRKKESREIISLDDA